MPRTKFSSRMKIAFLNIMQALGAAASQLASNAKLRVNEINLESRRHEILTEFSLQAFEMWHNGVELPKELSDMFKELSEIDDKLSILRAQKFAKVNESGTEAVPEGKEPLSAAEATAAKEPKPAAEKPPEKPEAKPVSENVSVKPINPEAKPISETPAAKTELKPTTKSIEPGAVKKPRTVVKRTVKTPKSKDNE